MPILPDLRNPCEALDKLARERLRVLHAGNDTDMVDHFMNFCITGWALADYLKRSFSLTGEAEKAAYDRWLSNPMVAACRDIANKVKHFELDKKAGTQEVRISKRGVVDVYEDAEGNLLTDLREDAPVVEVHLENGEHFDMWAFLHGVVRYWEAEIKSRGMECP